MTPEILFLFKDSDAWSISDEQHFDEGEIAPR